MYSVKFKYPSIHTLINHLFVFHSYFSIIGSQSIEICQYFCPCVIQLSRQSAINVVSAQQGTAGTCVLIYGALVCGVKNLSGVTSDIQGDTSQARRSTWELLET